MRHYRTGVANLQAEQLMSGIEYIPVHGVLQAASGASHFRQYNFECALAVLTNPGRMGSMSSKLLILPDCSLTW